MDEKEAVPTPEASVTTCAAPDAAPEEPTQTLPPEEEPSAAPAEGLNDPSAPQDSTPPAEAARNRQRRKRKAAWPQSCVTSPRC